MTRKQSATTQNKSGHWVDEHALWGETDCGGTRFHRVRFERDQFLGLLRLLLTGWLWSSCFCSSCLSFSVRRCAPAGDWSMPAIGCSHQCTSRHSTLRTSFNCGRWHWIDLRPLIAYICRFNAKYKKAHFAQEWKFSAALHPLLWYYAISPSPLNPPLMIKEIKLPKRTIWNLITSLVLTTVLIFFLPSEALRRHLLSAGSKDSDWPFLGTGLVLPSSGGQNTESQWPQSALRGFARRQPVCSDSVTFCPTGKNGRRTIVFQI